MEQALRYELNKINEIKNKIYPTNAPENGKPPYLVYFQGDYAQLKTLNGITDNTETSYLLNILAGSYSEMKDITKKVKKTVESFLLKEIGQDGIYVADLTIRKAPEIYEKELKLYRGIIDVTFYYEEV